MNAGWLPHNGGACPVDEDSFPQVLTRSGEQDCERASDQQWEWTGEHPDDEVVAYCSEQSSPRSLEDLCSIVEVLAAPHSLLLDLEFKPL